MSGSQISVPFFSPDIGEDEIAEVVDSLKNGWITTGGKTKRFEQDFSAFMGGLECVAVNSATAGLHLALEAIGIGRGDEVIVPDFTFTATAEVVRYLGADPVIIDVDEQSLNITPELIEAKITSRTKAIMVVHMAGLSADMSAILSLAKKHGLRVIEDAAHALPATHKAARIGTLESDATIFSFYATKTITTGEGGMIVSRHKHILDRCKVMRLHGIDRDAFDRYTAKNVSWQYDVVAPGYKYNLSDIAASIGIHQLKKVENFKQRREQIAHQYSKLLEGLPLHLPVDAPGNDEHSWHLYIIRLEDSTTLDRNELMGALSAENISCSVHFTPLHRLKYWRERYELNKDDFPVSERVFQSCLTLPLFPKMGDDQVEYVAKTIQKLLS